MDLTLFGPGPLNRLPNRLVDQGGISLKLVELLWSISIPVSFGPSSIILILPHSVARIS